VLAGHALRGFNLPPATRWQAFLVYQRFFRLKKPES